MKNYKRLAAGAHLYNNQATGYIILEFEDYDGGVFQLAPQLSENALILVDPSRPSGYGLEIRGSSPDTLRRVASALTALARTMESGEGDDDSSDEE